jgi:hypothetical protein
MPCPKLATKYFGPYKIRGRIGTSTYKHEFPDHCKIHPVFCVSQLKSFTASYAPVF